MIIDEKARFDSQYAIKDMREYDRSADVRLSPDKNHLSFKRLMYYQAVSAPLCRQLRGYSGIVSPDGNNPLLLYK